MGFFWYEDRTRKYDTKAPEKHATHILLKTNLQWAKDQEHHVNTENEDEIDESHKSQLKFEYYVYLLNYTIKIKNLKPKKP